MSDVWAQLDKATISQEQPADVGKQLPIMAKVDAKHLGNCPDELSVGQAQKAVLGELLPEEEGAFLGA